MSSLAAWRQGSISGFRVQALGSSAFADLFDHCILNPEAVGLEVDITSLKGGTWRSIVLITYLVTVVIT